MEAKKKKLRVWICILLVIAILLGACALTLTAVLAARVLGGSGGNGLLARSETVVETEHFEVYSGMMAYFFTEQLDEYYRYFAQLFDPYAASAEQEALVYQYMGIPDPDVSLKQQNFAGKTEDGTPITVFDYYMGLTEDYVTRLLTYCEYAYGEGIALTGEDLGRIADTVEQMEQDYKSERKAAKQAGEPYARTFRAYLKDKYGTDITKQDVRKCLELISLAKKAEQKLTEEQKQSMASNPSAVDQYVLENHADFYMADFYQYSITVNDDGMTDAEFEAAKQAAWLQIADLTVTSDMRYFENEVTELIIASEKQAFRERNWERYLRENGNDEAKAEAALQAYYDKTYTDAYKSMKFQLTLTTDYMHSDTVSDSDLAVQVFPDGVFSTVKKERVNAEHVSKLCDWLFGTEQNGYNDYAHAGDMTVIQSTTVKEKSNAYGNYEVETYTVAVYRCAREPYRNTEITKQFGYAIFQNKEHAEQFYAAYCKGEMNKDTLVATAEQMRGQLSAYAYDASESFLLDDFAEKWTVNWIWESGDLEQRVEIKDVHQWLQNAKPGDCSGVLEVVMATDTVDFTSSQLGVTAQKATPVYAILVYDGEGQEYWYTQALKGVTEQAGEDWYEKNKLALIYNREAYELIDK